MLLPWQRTFCHGRKCILHIYTPMATHFLPRRYHGKNCMCLAHLHPKANICAKFHENWWKTEEVVRDARFPPHFCHNMPLPWQHTFCHCKKKCVLHIYNIKANICAKFHENWWKTEEVVRDARFFPPIFAIICRYHGNILSATVEKCVLHIYNPRQTSVPNFMRIGEKLRK